MTTYNVVIIFLSLNLFNRLNYSNVDQVTTNKCSYSLANIGLAC